MKYFSCLYSYCGRPTRQWCTYHRVLGCQIDFVASKHNWLCRFVSVLCPIWATSNHFAEYRLIFGENVHFWCISKKRKIEIWKKMAISVKNSPISVRKIRFYVVNGLYLAQFRCTIEKKRKQRNREGWKGLGWKMWSSDTFSEKL